MWLLKPRCAASFSRLVGLAICFHSLSPFFFFFPPESKCQDDSTFFRGIVLPACFDKDWRIARLRPRECVCVWNNEQQSLQTFQIPHKKSRGNLRYLSLSSQDCRGFEKRLILSISYTGNKQQVQRGRTASLGADPIWLRDECVRREGQMLPFPPSPRRMHWQKLEKGDAVTLKYSNKVLVRGLGYSIHLGTWVNCLLKGFCVSTGIAVEGMFNLFTCCIKLDNLHKLSAINWPWRKSTWSIWISLSVTGFKLPDRILMRN